MRTSPLKLQQKIYSVHKKNPKGTVNTWKYTYAIAYNAMASIHTWIIQSEKGKNDFHWLHPLDKSIGMFG